MPGRGTQIRCAFRIRSQRKRDSDMKKKELELYVHIPFCVRKCAYCDFLSFPSGERERASYVDALIREIRSQKKNFTTHCVTTVFLGGGTPSVLSGDDTARIFRALRENFDISRQAEITMEVNPGTVTEEKAGMWKACGVNRLSIGLQSVNDEELRMLGRIHSFRGFLHTWEIVRDAGFDNINIDLISAVPGQTLESWEHTLRTAAELGPEHLSAYSLIIEEGTPFYEKYGQPSRAGTPEAGKEPLPPLPDEDTEREIYKASKRILEEYGYDRYEISNYAKEGRKCRHNLGYWERKEYLGLGLGAASLIEETRFHNTEDMEKYLDLFGQKGAESEGIFSPAGAAAEEIECLSEEERMEEFMFLGLRKTEGVSRDAFHDVFGKKIEDVYGEQISRFTGLGLLEATGGMICLTEKGIDVSNAIFSEFMI